MDTDVGGRNEYLKRKFISVIIRAIRGSYSCIATKSGRSLIFSAPVGAVCHCAPFNEYRYGALGQDLW
jgi:hypothetical protein